VSENGFIKWRNYWMAAAFTLMGTILTGMTEQGMSTWHWLSDVNVAIALFVAWLFDPRNV